MRSALYRSAWLLILCVLMVTFSVPSMPSTPASPDSNDVVMSLATDDTSCMTNKQSSNDRLDEYSLLVDLARTGTCSRSPSPVLIARDWQAQDSAAGAPTISRISAAANVR